MYVKEMIQLHDVRPNGILHIGAHKAEELEEYTSNCFNGNGRIFWVEAIPDLALDLKNRLDPKLNSVYNAVIWNEDDVEMTFNITSKTASSSVLEFGTHAETYPDISVQEKIQVRTKRIDSLFSREDKFEIMILDIQGAELQAIQSTGDLINDIKWIFTEVSKSQVYKGSALVSELDAELQKLGFERVFTVWERSLGWGDALYARKGLHSPSLIQKIESAKMWLIRLIRWLIPNSLYPLLVSIKRLVK